MKVVTILKGVGIAFAVFLFLALAAGGILFEQHSFSATFSGQITDMYGKPVQGTEVRLRIGGTDVSNNSFKAKTNKDGRYTLTADRIQYALDSSGAYRGMSIWADGYIPVSVNKRVPKGNNSGWNFKLTKAVTISGKMVDTKGNPMPDRNMYMWNLNRDKTSELQYRCKGVTTDKDGNFFFDTVGPFEYRF